MSICYKFKSAKDYYSITLNAPFISVEDLKLKIFESKRYGHKHDKNDLLVTNAQTNEEYADVSNLIPRNTSVIIRIVPRGLRMPIIAAPLPQEEEPMVKLEHGFVRIDSSMKYPDDLEMDDFGEDLYAIPEKRPSELSVPVQEHPEWQRQYSDGCGPGRGFGRGCFGQAVTPPEGYVCHRCKVPGHFIQHCTTNGDPSYDIKRARPPTGIPKSMLMPSEDGSLVLNGGGVVSVKPDEAVFEKELEGLFSKRSSGDLPPELRCPLCKEVMKDAVLTSKCCFKSFCDKCIRDLIVSKSVCICGATNVLADHLVPNMTLRDTISRMSGSDNSSSSNGGSASQVYGKESHNSKSNVPSLAQSETSNGEQPGEIDCTKMEAQCGHEVADEDKELSDPQDLDVVKPGETHEPISVKEPGLQGSLTLVPEKEHPKTVNGDADKNKKIKKAQMSMNGFDLKCVAPQYIADESYMMPVAPAAYNPYWAGSYTGVVPYMGFGCGPLPFPDACVFPQDPSFVPACPLPFGQPLSNPADLGMRSNGRPASMSRYEVEAVGKGDMKRKREIAKSQDRLHKQMISSGDNGSSKKLKYVCIFNFRILFFQLYLCSDTERRYSCGNFLAKHRFGMTVTIIDMSLLFHFISLLLFSCNNCASVRRDDQRVMLFQAPLHIVFF